MSVWDDLVGQEPAVDVLRRAVGGAAARLRGESGAATAGMTHAWLITGRIEERARRRS
jgi:DNA polymerase-3 subunit delta'